MSEGPVPEPARLPSLTAAELFLPRFSLERRITVLMLAATVLVVGLVATIGIPLEMFPRGYTSPSLGVDVPWRDAPAEEVMQKVVLPLEEELATVRGLDRINSFASTGRGSCRLFFKQGTDMKVAYREVRDRIERARGRLPEDADRIFIRKEDTSGFPIAFIVATVDPGLADPYDLLQNEVLLRLERIDGIASVTAHGLEEKEILIELDRAATEGSGLNIYQLAERLANDNFSLASGSVLTADRKLLLRSVARYDSVEALANRLVAPAVRLKDIAQVKYEEPEKTYRARVNGRPSIFIEVLKEGDANSVAVSEAIHAEITRLEANPRLSGVDLRVVFDQGSVIKESLDTVIESGKVGAWLAVAVIFFFLRRTRMTIIITLSIPISLFMALAVMYFAGETFNILSLLGLMICVGMLVDNSIVVAENIYRFYRSGLSRREAAIRGAGEISLAITLATLTSVTVFLPVSLVEGEMQFFLLRLSIPISVSLLASLLVALVVVPLAVYLTLPERVEDEDRALGTRLHRGMEATFSRLYDATLGRLARLYERWLAFFLHGRRWVDLGVAVLLVLGGAIALLATETVEVALQDQDERSTFEVNVEMPQSYTLEDAEQYFGSVEQVMARIQGELGLEGYFFFHTKTWGEIQGWAPQGGRPKYSPRQVTEKLLDLLPEKPGVRLYASGGDEDEKEKDATALITLYGEDAAALERVGTELEDLLASVPGVVAVQRAAERPRNELALVVDRDRAERARINPTAIAGVVGYALRGQALPRFYQDGRDIPVRVRFAEEDREGLAQLADFDVPSESGALVALSSVTDVEIVPGAKRIERRNKRMARIVTLELAEGEEDAARERVRAFARRMDLPEGVTWTEGETENPREQAEARDAKAITYAALLSIVFIYLLMAFLFESLVLPLSILVTLPLAFIGVVGLHLAAGKPIDMLGFVGVVLLIGVVVNNGIVLIDYVNRLRREGWESHGSDPQGHPRPLPAHHDDGAHHHLRHPAPDLGQRQLDRPLLPELRPDPDRRHVLRHLLHPARRARGLRGAGRRAAGAQGASGLDLQREARGGPERRVEPRRSRLLPRLRLPEVLQKQPVDLVRLFQRYAMPRAGEGDEPRAGQQAFQLFALAAGDHHVAAGLDDERRQVLEHGEPGAGVVEEQAAHLAEEGREGSDRREALGHLAAEHLAIDSRQVLAGEELVLERLHAPPAASQHRLRYPAPRLPAGEPVEAAAGVARDQAEALQPIASRERRLERHQPAHRDAGEVGPFPTEVIHQAERVGGQGLHAMDATRRPGAADATVVEEHHAMVLGEHRHLRPPRGAGKPEPHHQHHGRAARAGGLVPEADAVDFGVKHGVRQPSRSRSPQPNSRVLWRWKPKGSEIRF